MVMGWMGQFGVFRMGNMEGVTRLVCIDSMENVGYLYLDKWCIIRRHIYIDVML